MGFSVLPLDQPLKALNVDGTENKRGRITSFVRLEVTLDGKTMDIQFLVTGLGKQKILLGFPWLNKHNPDINWKTGEFAWRINRRPIKVKRYHDTIPPLARARWLTRQAIKQMIKPTINEEPDREEKLNRTQNPSDDGILLAYIGDMENEEGRDEEGEIWINAKLPTQSNFI
jgi:hypothetical protein